ncbi:MAG: peptidoglycan-associated lipoprotein Pal [Aestuariivirgaceae bacterium]
MLRFISGFRLALLCVAFLAIAGCSKKNTPVLDASGGSATPGSVAEFQTVVGDRIYFLVDQSSLTSEAQDTLSKQAEWLKRYSNVSVQVEGHADERGTREYNIALSARRATVTREFLVAQGIEPNRITTIAFGKERPVALCDAESCWSQNRRAVTVVTSGAVTQ